MTRAGQSERYTYDGDGTRVATTVGGTTTVYFEGLWEQIVGGATTQYYRFNGQVVAVRDSAAGVSYLYGDQLGSVSFATNANGSAISRQDYDAWGAVRSGGVSATSLNDTGQRLDSTGLLDYHARLYDPLLARFVSADSVVPSSASAGLDGVQRKPLTADFHEPGFVAQIGVENGQPFWFQLSDDERQQAGVPWGPANPQALNRYSYVQNNPLGATDPMGHWVVNIGVTVRLGAYLGGSYNVGVSFDGKGNIAGYDASTKGVTIGATLGAAVSGTVLPETETIDQTVGKGFNIGVSLPTEPVSLGGDVSFDTQGQNVGYSISAAVGAGMDIHIEKTDTALHARNLPQRIYSEGVNRLKQFCVPPGISY